MTPIHLCDSEHGSSKIPQSVNLFDSMKLHRALLRPLSLAMVLGVTEFSSTRADHTGVTILSPPPYSGAGGQGLFGWQFKTTAKLEIHSVGLYDWYITPQADGFFESHPIGIWDVSKPSQLLMQSLIPAGNDGTRDGDFLYVTTTPLVLEADRQYVVGAIYKSRDLFKLDYTLNVSNDPVLMEFGAGVEFEGYRFGEVNQLAFPSVFIAGERNGIGPNFKYSIVPEPSAVALLGLGALGLLAWNRRIKTASR